MLKNRILFVDDEPKILEALKRMLKKHAGEWEMARGGAVVARAAASLQALGTGALSWRLDTALCGAEAGASFSTIMTVCTVRGQLFVIP